MGIPTSTPMKTYNTCDFQGGGGVSAGSVHVTLDAYDTMCCHVTTVVPAKSDSDVILCLQLLSKTLTCTLHLS